ncbi:ABC transporter ATP-binding protein [Bombiscardovia nodaiensis]|uniref:ABC transporter ATP-binding protein n=1 Tax=Bombiscardovia nodaiensis TaxID=2932181 RepID=A0ABN6SF40_9BIFI|nr:ABC transporter ATP-binding protein [Bombiscardovia nodaiensis]
MKHQTPQQAGPASTKGLHIISLEKRFGQRVLWSQLSVSIRPSEMVAITGPSGSGKSTLLNCIGLLEEPSAGSIEVDGKTITHMGAHRSRLFRRNRLGYLFQDYALIDEANIEDNLTVAMQATQRSKRKHLIGQALERVGLEGRQKEPIYQLSGGEQQRVALARLLVKKPNIILADEPTGALDSANAQMVIDSLRAMAKTGGHCPHRHPRRQHCTSLR